MMSLPSERCHWLVSVETPLVSEFDKALFAKWEAAPLWYRLGDLRTRKLEGRYGFVVQLNEKRGTLRRKPEDVQHVRQPFDGTRFNFTKLDDKEVLFRRGDDILAVNVSPLESCHCLAIPAVSQCLPQVLTPAGLNFTLDLMLLSASPDLRAGFNSLGGFASVNHQHLHLYYLRTRMYLETAPVDRLGVPGVFALSDYAARGLVFSVEEGNRRSLDVLFRAVGLLMDHNIGHNIFITRGTNPSALYDHRPTTYEVIRIHLWARRSCFGTKDEKGFSVALCELAGHVPLKTEQWYNAISEDMLSNELKHYCDDAYERMMKILNENRVICSSST